MSTSKLFWSGPYHGVSHYLGPVTPAILQASLTDYGSFTEAYVLLKGGGFKPAAEDTFRGDGRNAEAKQFLLKALRSLGCSVVAGADAIP